MTRDIKGRPAATKRPKPVRGADAAAAAGEGDGRQRIAKLMARVGLCSRREAEVWIADGRVVVNGELLTSPARDVGPDDEILVDDAPLPMAEKTRLFLFHKPRGLVTSDHDPEGRDTVADFLRDNWPEGPRIVTVGRLDINTEGLLLLTNDGGLARVLELPQTGWVRRYRVRAKGTIDQPRLDTLAEGLTIDGIDYAGIEARLDRIQGANCWLTMGLREGKNREIKRVLEHVGLEVNRLIRLSFGPFQLLELEEGAVEEVRTRVLRDQLGEALAAQAGVDFGDAEVAAPPEPARGRDAGRPPRRGKRDDPAADEPPLERHERAAGPRRHVSTLRATEASRAKTAPRKRTERRDVTDVNARKVAVERRVLVRPSVTEEAAPRRGRKTASPSAEGKRARIARSGGGRPREDAREERRPRSEGARGPRRDRPDSERRPAARGERPERREARPPAGERSRTPRSDGDAPRSRSPRPDDRDGSREARAPRPERARSERPRFDDRRDERGARAADGRRDAGPRAGRSDARPRPERSATGGARRPEGDDRRKPAGGAGAKPPRGAGGAGRGGPPGKGVGRAPGKPAGKGPYKGPAKGLGKGPGKPRGPAAPRR